MRFEEVSPPVESRILAAGTAVILRLGDELRMLLNVFNSTDVASAINSLDTANVTTAATRAVAPGGLCSLLLATALLLRLLQSTLVRTRVRRYLRDFVALAHCKND
jgi:hypothetical protein